MTITRLSSILLFFCTFCGAEVFSSVSELVEVLTTENYLIENLENYIDLERKRLDLLTDKLRYYKIKHSESLAYNFENAVNAIYAFLLIKRTTTEWQDVQQIMAQNTAHSVLQNISMYRTIYPFANHHDLNGAAVALTRLQDVYQMTTSNVSNGFLLNTRYSEPLSAHDCLEIGKQLHVYGDNYWSLVWLQEALRRCESSEQKTEDLKIEILQKLRPLLAQENYTEAVVATEVTRKTYPYDEIGHENRQLYGQLCRGQTDQSPARLKELRCWLERTGNFIAPWKVEQLYKDPQILQFHEVLHDSEIERLKDLAKPIMYRAQVFNTSSGLLVVSKNRVSKSAFLDPSLDPILDKVSQRTEHFTRLNTECAESLQVLNYGLGGQFEPHNDYLAHEVSAVGNRVATVLYYMSDVALGGDTVFVKLGIGIRPEKGSAIVWFNLHKSGKVDERLMHAGCPILVGSKWVCTQWLRERGQEFLRPCGLTES